MQYRDLRDFLYLLKENRQLHEIDIPVSPYLEVTEICVRTLQEQGPALLFKNMKDSRIPLLGNLFGTQERIALAMGQTSLEGLREVGRLLAFLKQPQPPQGFKDLIAKIPLLKQVLTMQPKIIRTAICQEEQMEGKNVDLGKFPIQTCWPDDVAPLITWGLVTTKSPRKERANVGIYRQQVIAPNKVIMRWLKHRGGALDYAAWCQKNPDLPFPIAVTIGADPATILAAVTPIPDTLSEYAFAALLRGSKTELVKCITHDLYVPAYAEIVLEGFIYPNETAPEGPFGDHTGYYNEVESFPVMTIERICHRPDPIYHSTYTGRPPDEPAVLGLALNEVLLPILQQQFPEIVDFYLPAEGCSYRLAVVTIHKQYPGHAQRILLGIWSYLSQFMYTKFIIVCDADINARHWDDVIWALTTRVDPKRDMLMLEHSPIDYLDFAAPISGLGSKMGIDATNKWPGETSREWGKSIKMSHEITTKIDDLWETLAIPTEKKS